MILSFRIRCLTLAKHFAMERYLCAWRAKDYQAASQHFQSARRYGDRIRKLEAAR